MCSTSPNYFIRLDLDIINNITRYLATGLANFNTQEGHIIR